MDGAKGRERDDDGVGDDMFSRLPEPVLLHILCFLSLKKALQTSVLSKSWRHLGSTRPVINLCGACGGHSHVRGISGVCEKCFDGNKEEFLSVLDTTFQRYHDQNLFTQGLHLQMLCIDPQSISLLEKWIPIFINPDKPSFTTFHLWFHSRQLCGCWPYFNLPSVVLKAESLRELCLHRCRLNEINAVDNVLLKNLQKLSLTRVHIVDEALEKIISGCPLVKSLVMHYCEGFKSINIGNKNRYLNCFEFSCSYRDIIQHSIEIDAPTLKSIRIVGSSNWYPNNSNYFPRLKYLFLLRVNLSTELFHNFSFNFPRLQELTLIDCSGFEEIKLSSCLIKRLIILPKRPIKKLCIEVPNIHYFRFWNRHLPTTLSVTTTSQEWKSHFDFHYCMDVHEDDVLLRILKLFEMLKSISQSQIYLTNFENVYFEINLFEMVKSLSQSQISLTLSENVYFKINQTELDFNDHHPVAMEHLRLNISKFCPDSLSHFLNVLFHIFRPRYTNAACVPHNDNEGVTKFLWKTLIHEREKTEYGWEQHLEEVSIETSDDKGKVWHHVQWTFLPDQWSENQKIRFRLKWGD